MNWCTRCVLPDTRPGIVLDAAGVCSACRAHGTRDEAVDWAARAAAFGELVERTRALRPPLGLRDPGLRRQGLAPGRSSPASSTGCTRWRSPGAPPGRTALGQRNLDNLIALGVDHVDFTCNPQVERKLPARQPGPLRHDRDPDAPGAVQHPAHVAARYDVPLVVWGENSAAEYVGDTAATHRLDAEWVRRYGAVHGTTAADWVSDELTEPISRPTSGPPTPSSRPRASTPCSSASTCAGTPR